MIADFAFTSLKPSKVLLGCDHQLPALNSNHGLDVERASREQLSDANPPLEGRSCVTNVANSECSRVDDPYFKIDEESVLFPEESGLSSYIVNILEDEDVDSVFDPLTFECLDCEEPLFPIPLGISPTNPLSPLMQSSETPTLVTHSPSLKRKNKAPCCQKKKSWLVTEYSKKRCYKELQIATCLLSHRSELTKCERRDVVEDLSLTISQNLCLREQIEVIRIIKPTASISTSDTEFVIDMNSITEKKLTKIREYIHTHSTGTQHTCDDNKKRKGSKFSTQKKDNKKQKTKEKKASKVPKQSLSKEDKQRQKELRSGLFTREEVVFISTSESHNGDVDVLE
ncbi:hypothetical protein CHS0354_028771 [Potamilus streckersoni]|uniref:Uncharacterized protein n=1 Tax=Potamilus streckersoni TaxID=2493646 RepID=A0AAE0S8V6_9BIVA|nr:hypothetical protein CHS0354_028771 [Potamilus streckersoni]